MNTVTSRDGTTIAFDRTGSGPALILVDGALCSRSFGPMRPLAEHLAPHFTVYAYDRRGRGESGDMAPFAVEREIEDIDALIAEIGGSAFLYGISSGAILALDAACERPHTITKLALYEPPFSIDEVGIRRFKEYRTQLDTVLAEGRRGDAVELFMRLVGANTEEGSASDAGIAGMRQSPVWPVFEAVAPTLAYDAAAMGDSSVPTERAAALTIPTLVMDGGSSFPFMHTAANNVAAAMPDARRRTLEGQTHDVAAEVLAPMLIEFFAAA